MAAAAIGCGSSATTSTTATAPTSSRCQISLNSPSQTFGPPGGTAQITVNFARECSWSSSTSASWIEFTSGKDGQGDGTIAYRVKVNPDPVARRSSIVVGDQHADVAQDPAPCQYNLSSP